MQGSKGKSESLWRWLALLLVVASLLPLYISRDQGDKSWMLMVAGMVLDGKHLYVDIFEANPPLIFWLYTLPVTIGRGLGVTAHNALVTGGLLLAACSIFLCLRVMRYHPQFASARQREALLWLCVLAFVAHVYPSYFMEREYLFMVLVFPYMLRWMPALSGRTLPLPLCAVIAVCAGVGFCIKPHNIVVLAAIGVMVFLRERKLSVLLCLENLIIAGMGGGYLACVLLFAPEYIDSILPIARVTYGGYGAEHRLYSLMYFVVPCFSLLLALVGFRRGYETPYRRDLYYLLGVCGATFLYACLNNGWGYTFFPLLCLSFFICGWMGWEFAWCVAHEGEGANMRLFQQGATICKVIVALNCVGMVGVSLGVAQVPEHKLLAETSSCLQQYIKQTERTPLRSFGAISLGFQLWPVLQQQAGGKFETRYYHFWMLPKFKQSGEAFAQQNHWVLDYVTQWFIDDLEHNRPGVVFVERKYHYLLDYLNESASFQSQWARYGIQDVPSYCGYDVYRRL